jgi:hypothetical protein
MSRSASHRPRRLVLASATLVSLAAVLSGCSLFPKPAPDPTRHYVLTGPTPAAINAGVKQGTLKVGLRSIQIAPYLDGKSMIVRRGDNEIDYNDYARWAEPLATGIHRMLVARLHLSDRVGRVFPQPYPFDVTRDVEVSVSVLRCEGRVKSDGRAVVSFVCAVEITRVADDKPGPPDGGKVLLREVFEAPDTEWREGDHAALAAALSANVAKLADFIVANLPAK